MAAIVAMTVKATKSPAFVSISGDFGSSQLFAQNIHRTRRWKIEADFPKPSKLPPKRRRLIEPRNKHIIIITS